MSVSFSMLRSGPGVASLLAAGFVAVAAVACGSAQPTSTSTTRAPSASVAATGAPVPATAPKPSPLGEAKAVQVLPVSVLMPIAGLTYAKIKGSPDISPYFAGKASVLEGLITREMVRGPAIAGTVQLVRVRPGVIPDASRDEALRTFLFDFANTRNFTEVRINGQNVLTSAQVRDTGGTVAGWLKDRDIVVIFARRGLSAEKIARSYLAGT